MNPFLKNPVAEPLGELPRERWPAPKSIGRVRRAHSLSRQVGVAAMAAGLAVGFSAYAIDVNVASVAQLESLRGIGPRTAKLIVHERTRAGAFASMEDLSDRVRGLGERRVRALQAAGLEIRADSAGQDLRMGIPDESRSPVPKKSKRRLESPVAKPEVISPPPF